ncbi:MAG: BadF/BadG/BcrA/BcrD ATPase family protein [Spirochaetota bacterium]
MIIGIDGGGSKTKFLLCDLEGRELASLTRGSTHYHQVGFAVYESIIREGIDSLCRAAACAESELRFICIGVPGYGESAQDQQRLDALAAQILPAPYELLNDVKLAWAGALACQPGICLLAGTGSMAYAVDEANQDLRAGGWGPTFGDEGSALWLGTETCRLFSKMADGRAEKGPLYGLLKAHLGLSSDFDLINRIHKMADRRTEIALLAPILYQAHQSGDTAAWEIFVRGARELARMAAGVVRSYRGPQPIPASYNGGVFQGAGASFVRELNLALEAIDCPVTLQAPKLSPVAGACLYSAQKLASQGPLPEPASFSAILADQRAARPVSFL